MKTRNGFVSNSSSSSFCVIGITNEELIKEIFDKEFKNIHFKDEYDWYDFYSDKEGYFKIKEPIQYVRYSPPYFPKDTYPNVIGFDAGVVLQDKNIKEAKEIFKKYIKDNFDIDIEERYIKYICEESSSD